MIIIRQKVFDDSGFNKGNYIKWLKKKFGLKPKDKFPDKEFNEYMNNEALIQEFTNSPISEAEAEGKKVAEEALKKENENIAKNSIFNRGKEFVKKHKTPIIATAGTLAAGTAAYGAYRHYKSKDEEKRSDLNNDAIRKSIVNGKK